MCVETRGQTCKINGKAKLNSIHNLELVCGYCGKQSFLSYFLQSLLLYFSLVTEDSNNDREIESSCQNTATVEDILNHSHCIVITI